MDPFTFTPERLEGVLFLHAGTLALVQSFTYLFHFGFLKLFPIYFLIPYLLYILDKAGYTMASNASLWERSAF